MKIENRLVDTGCIHLDAEAFLALMERRRVAVPLMPPRTEIPVELLLPLAAILLIIAVELAHVLVSPA